MTTAHLHRSLSRLVRHGTRQRVIPFIGRISPTCCSMSKSPTTASLVRWHSAPVEQGENPKGGDTGPETIAAAAAAETVDVSRFTTVIEVRMPDMGSSTGDSKILKWHKAEGDLVRTDDVLCDIETPDFVYGMECEDDELQIMGRILVDAPSGPVPANQVICTLLHETKETKVSATEAHEPKT